MSQLYKHFARDWKHSYNFSEEMKLELYNYETFGSKVVTLTSKNGYALGKSWLNVTVAMWKEGIEEGTFFKFEFYKNPDYPHWWLDSIFENVTQGCCAVREYHLPLAQ